MKNPTNKGVGTGTAVVRNYDTLNSATSNFFKGLGDKVDKDNLKKEKDAIKKQAMVDQLSGKLGEYDPTKMRIADKDIALEMYNGIVNKYRGKYGEMLGGNPALTNEYNNDIARMKIFISDSASSVAGFAAERKAVFASDSGYSPEKQAEVMDYITSPESTMDGYNKLGLGTRDQVIGFPLNDMADKFQDKQSVFYAKVNDRASQTTGASGEISRTWIGDAEGLVLFKNALEGSPKQLANMNIMYKNLPVEERPEAFFQDFKTHLKNNEIENIPGGTRARTPGDKKTYGRNEVLGSMRVGTADYSSGEDIELENKEVTEKYKELARSFANKNSNNYIPNVQDREAAQRELVKQRNAEVAENNSNPSVWALTFSKSSDAGGDLSPFTFGGKTHVISEIKKKKNGEFWMTSYAYKNEASRIDPNIIGEIKYTKVNNTLKSHFEDKLNIYDIDKYYANVIGRTGKGSKLNKWGAALEAKQEKTK